MTPWLISDWYHENPFALFYVELEPSGPPEPVSTLLQGKGIFCSDAPVNENCTGSYWETTFVQNLNWSIPTLKLLTDSNTTFPPSTVPIFLDYEDGVWVYFLIESNFSTTTSPIFLVETGHPIHLHGHDFFILDQSTTPFDAENFRPDLGNPPRRDTAMVPNGGYMVIELVGIVEKGGSSLS